MSFTWGELDHMSGDRQWHIPLPPTCRKCDYNLTGLPSNRCPECGTPFNWKEVRRRASRTWALAVRLRHANQDAMTGIIFGLAGWTMFGFAKLLILAKVHLIYVILYLMIFIISFLTIVLGSGVLNIRRVPHWARPYIGDPPPNILLGVASILLGLSLLTALVIL
ncbi:MAG: hypothetical protein JSV03_00375 [Planctomycetota bacterium]|nr:MAG: hypothetical protein JSV03_00375 [Planctomycetota bacterium]